VPDLVVEIGCEELPASACREAGRQLVDLLRDGLERAGLAADELRTHVAPRRLALIALGLPSHRPARRSEVRGPRVDAPEQARAGFARKHGLAADRLVERDGFVWAVSEGQSTPAEDLVGDLVRSVAEGIRFSKSMRWDGGRFSRPVRWLVVKLDERVVPVQEFGLTAGGRSRGHRFAGGEVEVRSARTYLEDVRSVRAVADAEERREAILAGLDAAGEWGDPLGKLDEVVHLVEWPGVHEGGFDERFLELPSRVVVTAMQSHQRYFPRMAGERLLPRFLFVANGGEPDVVIRGNEEVLVGRLADAEFAYRTDLERGMAAMVAELGRVSFLEGSGSLADKTARMRALAARLCDRLEVDAATRSAALRAAELAKADLVSNLVREFSDLEGFAGSVYARHAGESEATAAAIAEHHLPYGFGGPLPSSAAGAIVSIADKADTLATAFRLGLEPTGSRDPYGLRRAAAGLVAIALDREWNLGVPELVGERPLGFLLDRVEALLTEQGVAVEEVRAARGSGEREPVAVAAVARALHEAAGPGRDAIRDVYGRCRRIAADADPSDLDAGALADPAERDLLVALVEVERRMDQAAGDARAMLAAAGDLVAPVTAFFDQVLVMAPEEAVRQNRLALVARVAACLHRIADFDQLPG
jgi:glycyl-tRNA synthetase beta chain